MRDEGWRGWTFLLVCALGGAAAALEGFYWFLTTAGVRAYFTAGPGQALLGMLALVCLIVLAMFATAVIMITVCRWFAHGDE